MLIVLNCKAHAHTTERNKNLDNQTLFKIQHIACDEKENVQEDQTAITCSLSHYQPFIFCSVVLLKQGHSEKGFQVQTITSVTTQTNVMFAWQHFNVGCPSEMTAPLNGEELTMKTSIYQ